MVSKIRHVQSHPTLMGQAGMTPLNRHVSSARLAMTHGFRSQAIYTQGIGPRAHYSGVEDEVGKYTFNVRFPCDAEVHYVIHKEVDRSRNMDLNPVTIIIYRNVATNEFSYLEVKRHNCMHQYYGYPYVLQQDYQRAMTPGEKFRAGTVIAEAPQIMQDGTNCYGQEVLHVNLSTPEGTEDGCLMSEEWCAENKSFCVENATIRFGGNEFLLNTYGDVNNHIGLPKIGDIIRPDGLLVAKRKIKSGEEDRYLDSVLLHPKSLLETEYGDIPTYASMPGAVITDIKIIRGKSEKPMYPPMYDEEVMRLYNRQTDYYSRLLEIEYKLKRTFGNNRIHATISEELSGLFVDAMANIEGHGNGKKAQHESHYEKIPVKNWLVNIEYTYWRPTGLGSKIADEMGCKHIIGALKPRAHMPRDADGNVADLVTNPEAIISRNNTSGFIVQWLGACSVKLSTKLKLMMSEGKYDEAWKELYGFYTLITDQVIPLLNDSRFDAMEELRDATRYGFVRAFIPTDNSKWESYFDLVLATMENYAPCYGPVSYIGYDGNLVTTKSNTIIGPKYIMVLEKDGRDGTAVGSSRLHGTFGVPTKPSNPQDKASLPGKESPVKLWADAEKRGGMAAFGGANMRVIDEYNGNVNAHRAVMDSIYRAGNPAELYEAVDFNKVKMSGGRMVRFMRSMFQAAGVKIVESEH